MDSLLALDETLFFIINNDWHIASLDTILPFWRNKLFWIPLYVFLISFSLLNFKRQGLYFIFAAIIAVGIADSVSSQLIKKTIQRQRPCNQEVLRNQVKLLVPCGGGYSFTSSHAANHFALATFISLTLGGLVKGIRLPLFLWAGIISFAQVYVGVHFPLDVFCGAMLGIFVGYIVATFFSKRIQLHRAHTD